MTEDATAIVRKLQALAAIIPKTTNPIFQNSLTVNNVGTGALPVSIQGQVGNTTWPALYMGVTPTATNYTLLTDGSLTALNSPTFLVLKARGTNMMFMSSNPTLDGVTAFNEWFGLTVTGQTAGTERVQYVFGGNNITFATGAIALQRNKSVTASTYNFVGASVITIAAGLEVRASLAGTLCTITNNYSIRATGGVGLQVVAGSIASQGIVIGSLLGTTSQMAIYAGVTPSTTNYSFTALSNFTAINYGAIGSFIISSASNTRITFDDTNGMAIASKGINTTAGDSATINSLTGRFRKDTTGSTFTLTNSFINANSIINLTNTTAGLTTGNQMSVVAGAGSAIITFETNGVAAAPSANADINFWIIN